MNLVTIIILYTYNATYDKSTDKNSVLIFQNLFQSYRRKLYTDVHFPEEKLHYIKLGLRRRYTPENLT